MRWDRGHQSPNVEDRRGRSAGGPGGVGLGTLLWVGSRFGWRGLLVVAAVVVAVNAVSYFTRDDARPVGQVESVKTGSTDEMARFVGFVFDDIQNYWQRDFTAHNERYQEARLVLFTNAVDSACGFAESATGPFYCPSDARAFIDLGFYDELRDRFGAPGDFAQAYVLAHEVGHHVQTLSGAMGARGSKGSIQTELQADCLAGAWAKDAERRGLLELGDLDEALRAAASIGDDRLQRQATGRVSPETWTHGSSAQRLAALRSGYEAGNAQACGLRL